MKPDRSGPDVASAPTSEGETVRYGHARWVFLASLLLGVLLRILYLAQPWRADQATFPMFRGDEGMLGLMGRHIIEGARPIFIYGVFHQGALDAYLVAVSFMLFGKTLLSLRLMPVVLAVACIGLTYLIGRELYGRRAALLAASLVAVPSPFFFLWGAHAQPAYVALIVLLLITVYAALLVLKGPTWPRLAGFGLAAGLAGFDNQIALPYMAVCALIVVLSAPLRPQHIAVAVLAWVIGIAPLLYGNAVIPFASVRQLGRKAYFSITMAKSRVRGSRHAAHAHGPGAPDAGRVRHYRSLPILEVLGAQQDREGTYSVLGSVGAAVVACGLIGALRRWFGARRVDPGDCHRHSMMLALVGVALIVGIAGFTGQPVGRYQLLLYPLLSVLAAGWIVRAAPRVALPLIALVVAGHAWATVVPPPTDGSVSDDEILRALTSKGIQYGYTAGGMYDLVFRSEEQVVLVPLDHSRYAPYENTVAAAGRISYIYRTDEQRKPAHEAFLRLLTENGVRYQQMDIGVHHVLYDFEPRSAITPEFINKVRSSFRKVKFGRRESHAAFVSRGHFGNAGAGIGES